MTRIAIEFILGIWHSKALRVMRSATQWHRNELMIYTSFEERRSNTLRWLLKSIGYEDCHNGQAFLLNSTENLCLRK